MAEKVKAGIRASKYLDENTRYDVLELLGHLEGELQAKDLTIAALKSECLKHILYSLREDQNSLNDPVLALGRDSLKVETSRPSAGSDFDTVHLTVGHRIKVLQTLADTQRSALKKLTNALRESQVHKANLIRELEDERRNRERDTAQGDDITYCLEKDRTNLKKELEAESSEKAQLQAELEALKEKLKNEEATKKQMILTLVEDRKKMAALYLEEKKRSEDLNRLLREERTKVNTLSIGLEEESKRCLAMEEEMERYLHQAGVNKDEISSLRVTQKELEDALRRARQEADHFKKQLAEAHRVAMSQASTTAVAAAVAPVTTQQQFLPENLIDPYPKWTTNQISTIPPVSETYQPKTIVTSIYDQDPGLNNNRGITTNSSISRTITPGVSSTVLGMAGSAETTRHVKPPLHGHPKVVSSHHALGKKVAVTAGVGKGGVPPPVPPNKPAMSALYKPLAGVLKVDTSDIKK